jgi:hypothetical protein
MYRTPTLSSPLIVSTVHNRIAAYDRVTGRPIWLFQSASDAGWLDHIRIDVDNERLYYLHYRNSKRFKKSIATIGCLDYLTGTEIWQHSIATAHARWVNATLLVTAEQIFIACHSMLYAFDRDFGTAQWSQIVVGVSDSGARQSIGLAVPGLAIQTDVREVEVL